MVQWKRSEDGTKFSSFGISKKMFHPVFIKPMRPFQEFSPIIRFSVHLGSSHFFWMRFPGLGASELPSV